MMLTPNRSAPAMSAIVFTCLAAYTGGTLSSEIDGMSWTLLVTAASAAIVQNASSA
jgi:hypothetical protein